MNQIIREVLLFTGAAIICALALYGVSWLLLFSPEHFEMSLSQLNALKSDPLGYDHFFNDMYIYCLSVGGLIVLVTKSGEAIFIVFFSQCRQVEKRASGGIPLVRMPLPKKMTRQDIRYVCAHEAGHLLVYAALGQLPSSIRAEVKEYVDRTDSLGYVTKIISKKVSVSRLFVEWEMLTLLAGREGEYALLQDNTLGSTLDNYQWLHHATSYLKNYFDGIFYVEPEFEFEFKSNEAKLNALKEKQTTLLQQFFSLNLEAYSQLVSLLEEKKILQSEEIIQFFQQANIKFPSDFPFPFGTFKRFSAEWTMGEEYGEVVQMISEKLESK